MSGIIHRSGEVANNAKYMKNKCDICEHT